MDETLRAATEITVAMIGRWVSPEDGFLSNHAGEDRGASEAAGDAAADMFEQIYRRIRRLQNEDVDDLAARLLD